MAVPLLAAVGVAVDYSRMTLARAELQSAADAAALAAVSTNSQNYKNGGTYDGLWSSADAKKNARAWFQENYGKTYGLVIGQAQADIKRVGMQLTATVSVQASVPATFMKLAGKTSSPVSVNATAVSNLPPYSDVYVLADNSPSMAIGATPTEIAEIERLTGCQFACHDLADPDPYDRVRAAGVTLRIDATAEALASLISKMQAKTSLTNQFRIAAYHFGERLEQQQITAFVPQTSNLSQAAVDAKKLPLMSIPYAGYNHQKGTDFDTMLKQIEPVIGKGGTGSTSTSRVKTLLMVTDGLNATLTPPRCPIPLNPTDQCQSPIDPDWCSTIKKNGVNIAVLYTTYDPVDHWWYDQYIAPIMPNVPTALQNCASPNMYAEVKPHQGIDEALEALFFKSEAAPRLTN